MNKRKVLQNLFLRPPLLRPQNLHPAAKKLQNQITSPPQPLSYPLNDLPEKHTGFIPLGTKIELPFSVERSFMGNLPVYKQYRNKRLKSRTIIRHVSGDVDSFVTELTKIVSNSPIRVKVGTIEVSGLHTESINLWLTRLGF